MKCTANYDKEKDVTVFSVSRHSMKYISCGQFRQIKESVSKGILNHSKVKDSFGKVCSCVAKILSWIDMAAFHNVCKTLVLTDSLVLKARELAYEVRNLQRAVEAVFDTLMPQYFRILENCSKHYMIQSSSSTIKVGI